MSEIQRLSSSPSFTSSIEISEDNFDLDAILDQAISEMPKDDKPKPESSSQSSSFSSLPLDEERAAFFKEISEALREDFPQGTSEAMVNQLFEMMGNPEMLQSLLEEQQKVLIQKWLELNSQDENFLRLTLRMQLYSAREIFPSLPSVQEKWIIVESFEEFFKSDISDPSERQREIFTTDIEKQEKALQRFQENGLGHLVSLEEAKVLAAQKTQVVLQPTQIEENLKVLSVWEIEHECIEAIKRDPYFEDELTVASVRVLQENETLIPLFCKALMDSMKESAQKAEQKKQTLTHIEEANILSFYLKLRLGEHYDAFIAARNKKLIERYQSVGN